MDVRFCRYEIRTLEVDPAREFYRRLLGHDRAVVWPLHEQARARGAVAHWLGSIGVGDVGQLERTSEDLVRRGATLLAPTREAGDGRHAAVLRDPGGAILGLTTGPAAAPGSTVDVSWHVLNTNHVADAIVNYRELFGWSISPTPSTGPSGAFHEFRWGEAEQASAGVMADLAGRPGVHPHWLFFFDVASLDSAVEWIRTAGGSTTDPITPSAGERIAICEDPQRAAFGIIERLARRPGTR